MSTANSSTTQTKTTDDSPPGFDRKSSWNTRHHRIIIITSIRA
ncbi:unnamed protein product [Acanthoscelides obtectus]|uniref:Uncharacterized protein n=1 Tax=Acanthoscelides obtectus TaxID=200917 RepID=A0A9P0JLW0_ACAOB|nr:unnamed protein product [Acanthoscelides obtectus]CAK1654378.1 hypothetical protein AOBTE_LOCUS18551 [Acanthoscelides obtectus]